MGDLNHQDEPASCKEGSPEKHFLQMSGSSTPHLVLETDYRGYHGMRTRDILGGAKSWGPK